MFVGTLAPLHCRSYGSTRSFQQTRNRLQANLPTILRQSNPQAMPFDQTKRVDLGGSKLIVRYCIKDVYIIRQRMKVTLVKIFRRLRHRLRLRHRHRRLDPRPRLSPWIRQAICCYSAIFAPLVQL